MAKYNWKKRFIKTVYIAWFFQPGQVAQIIGITEITAALLVLIKPYRPVIFALFIWKMGSELLYPHYEFFEWIERGGSYGALLALWIITEKHPAFKFITGGRYASQKTFTAGAE